MSLIYSKRKKDYITCPYIKCNTFVSQPVSGLSEFNFIVRQVFKQHLSAVKKKQFANSVVILDTKKLCCSFVHLNKCTKYSKADYVRIRPNCKHNDFVYKDKDI